MANEPMELAINYSPKKTPLPALAQVKYDGVPLVFTIRDNDVVAITRQNEYMRSVPHLIELVEPVLRRCPPGARIIAECFVPGKPFKYSNGKVRAFAPCYELLAKVFDGWLDRPTVRYAERLDNIKRALVWAYDLGRFRGRPMEIAHSRLVLEHDEVIPAYDAFVHAHGKIEGMMLHHTEKPFQEGKRCHGMGRYKRNPTIDLFVHSYEEAVSKDKQPLGMVGRVNVTLHRRYHDRNTVEVVGIGPGKLTHKERREIWCNAAPLFDLTKANIREPVTPVMCEAEYMYDPSYKALRQATFQRFRLDKSITDVLAYDEDN